LLVMRSAGALGVHGEDSDEERIEICGPRLATAVPCE
jgi:hypothetical protein